MTLTGRLKTFRTWLLAALIYAVYMTLRATWRIRVVESPSLKRALKEKRMLVMAHWHGDELGIIHLIRPYRASVMTSTSKDGDLVNFIVHFFGVKTARGSSTRGGVGALKGMIRLAKEEGYIPSVAVDGPKGPYHKAKPGIFEISKLLDCEIAMISVACDRSFVFKKAWNKSFLPLPFARVVAVWGELLPKVPEGADCRNPALALSLENALTDAGQQARNLIAEM
jgi:lysophospholipid acyltransferase (LPLAT)-like uncharacterized protein